MTGSGVRTVASLLLALAMLSTAGCTGDDAPQQDQDPAAALSAAKTELDQTAGVRLTLSTPELPEGVAGLLRAEGLATHQPAFQGDVVVRTSGIEATVPTVSVDSTVYAKLPLTTRFTTIDPAQYGAPDPATLMHPEEGLSSWLTATEDVVAGERVRDGGDVLSRYDGRLPGEQVVSVLPTADAQGEFDASFAVDEAGRLRSATVTGPFYAGSPEVTYTVRFEEYDVDSVVTAP